MPLLRFSFIFPSPCCQIIIAYDTADHDRLLRLPFPVIIFLKVTRCQLNRELVDLSPDFRALEKTALGHA
jgi:hypothetical protein